MVSHFWLPFCDENYICLRQDGGRAKFAGNFCAFPFKRTFRMRPFLSISISTDSIFNLFFILLSDDLELVTKHKLPCLLLLIFQEQKEGPVLCVVLYGDSLFFINRIFFFFLKIMKLYFSSS